MLAHLCGKLLPVAQAVKARGAREAFCFDPGIARHIAGQLQGKLQRLVAQGGDRLRKPPVKRAVHEQKGKQGHEHDGRERKQECPEQHARPEPGAQHARAAITVHLEDVARQQQQQQQQQQEKHNRDGREEKQRHGAAPVRRNRMERVQRAHAYQQKQETAAKQEEAEPPF